MPIQEVPIPPRLAVLASRNTVLFPGTMVPLVIGRPPSIAAVEEAIRAEELICVTAQREEDVEDPGPDDLFRVGTAAAILRLMRPPQGPMTIVASGVARVAIRSIEKADGRLRAQVEKIEDVIGDPIEIEALRREIIGLATQIGSARGLDEGTVRTILDRAPTAGLLADAVATQIELKVEERQALLEEPDVVRRMGRLLRALKREAEIQQVGTRIRSQVQETFDKAARERYLREQIRAIQQELGEGDEHGKIVEEFRRRLDAAGLPKGARKEAARELDRFAQINPASAEYTVSRTYLEWLADLPWSKSTEDAIDLAAARTILDKDHYDLDKVKDRILEYLAVRKLRPQSHGPILCFVGPPGTGKTSLGHSIAEALGRKFVRISLGGVRDEAEIRGHRRTYVGALPGRIIQGIRRAGTRNPVFMLDEIDKLGADFRGDPAAALLEVLDPAQNGSFADHYLDVEFDLSQVLFITTANMTDTIPSPLLDRMEQLELSGYTEEEKLAIARRYLVPRQRRENGIPEGVGILSDDAIRRIIADYTREAGLRNLEREIGTVSRKVAAKLVETGEAPAAIEGDAIPAYLGPQRFFAEIAERTKEPGVATGLAWTPVGGEILFIEAMRMPGDRRLTLTGRLGDVMRESAQAALSYVRANAGRLRVDPETFDKCEIHVHVPGGAVPKDGPSAGVALVTAIVSMLRGVAVRSNVAMTGEITLRGKVLPVGGIKDKVLAARRAGIGTVILPSKNRKDFQEIPEKVRENLSFVWIDRIDEAIDAAFDAAGPAAGA
ncbi:MAG: endopeptidase La [Planctomycetes bacterium]|nr:endopeptidase La [Planctomycetota bacterium]